MIFSVSVKVPLFRQAVASNRSASSREDALRHYDDGRC